MLGFAARNQANGMGIWVKMEKGKQKESWPADFEATERLIISQSPNRAENDKIEGKFMFTDQVRQKKPPLLVEIKRFH